MQEEGYCRNGEIPRRMNRVAEKLNRRQQEEAGKGKDEDVGQKLR